MRYSRQRECILRAVRESAEHPTANMVYDALKAELPHLSLGTVYRNLNQLADAGRLRKIPLPDGGCRFDGTTQAHSHIVCQGCGRVADVTLPVFGTLAEAVERETTFALTSCDVVMRGVCAACAQRAHTQRGA